MKLNKLYNKQKTPILQKVVYCIVGLVILKLDNKNRKLFFYSDHLGVIHQVAQNLKNHPDVEGIIVMVL